MFTFGALKFYLVASKMKDSFKGRKLFLILSVVIPFLVYSAFYYAPYIRNAPYKAKEFVSLSYRWGLGQTLDNSYDSATGLYSYINQSDSLVQKKINLSPKDIHYLDSIAHVQGFFNLPELMANSAEDLNNPKLLRYELTFNYQKKSKKVVFFANFNGKDRMKSAFSVVRKEIEMTLADKD